METTQRCVVRLRNLSRFGFTAIHRGKRTHLAHYSCAFSIYQELPTLLNTATSNTSTASVSATVNVALPRSVCGGVFMLRRERERVRQKPLLVRHPYS
jgi:hypothetical protein